MEVHSLPGWPAVAAMCIDARLVHNPFVLNGGGGGGSWKGRTGLFKRGGGAMRAKKVYLMLGEHSLLVMGFMS